MAAIGVHVARIARRTIDGSGNVVNKSNQATSISSMLNTSMEDRIIPDAAIPNSADHPNIQDYLIAEAAAGYVVQFLDQSFVITYVR